MREFYTQRENGNCFNDEPQLELLQSKITHQIAYCNNWMYDEIES